MSSGSGGAIYNVQRKDETGLHFLIANFVVGSSAAAAFSEPSPSAIAFSFKEETL